MTTLFALGGVLIFLGMGFFYAVRTGKKLQQASALNKRIDKVANINEFNRAEDEEANKQAQNSGDNPSPVRAPWIRRVHKRN